MNDIRRAKVVQLANQIKLSSKFETTNAVITKENFRLFLRELKYLPEDDRIEALQIARKIWEKPDA